MNIDNEKPTADCAFAEDLVLYLYDEAEMSSDFRLHLDKCDLCRKEISEFSAVRSSIADWRKESFENLPAPIIILPETAPVSQTADLPSFGERFRAFFNRSPVLSASFAAVLMLLFSIGAIYYFTKSDSAVNDVSALNAPVTEPSAVPRTDTETTQLKKVDISKTDIPQTDQSPQKDFSKDIEVKKSTVSVVKTDKPSKQPETVKEKSARITPAVKKAAKKPAPPVKKFDSEPPRLLGNEDIAEAQPLRLSDIFGELEDN